MYGGKLKYRCINEYGILYDDEQICSITSSGYQCPEGYKCVKTNNNPYYSTVGFDNILYSCLTIFQVNIINNFFLFYYFIYILILIYFFL